MKEKESGEGKKPRKLSMMTEEAVVEEMKVWDQRHRPMAHKKINKGDFRGEKEDGSQSERAS